MTVHVPRIRFFYFVCSITSPITNSLFYCLYSFVDLMIFEDQFRLRLVTEKSDYSNAPSLLPLLPFRGSSLLRAYPTPSATVGHSVPLGSPTFMCYLIPARNRILPRVSFVVHIVVNPNKVTGFSNSERLANTTSVTRLDYSSLQNRNF